MRYMSVLFASKDPESSGYKYLDFLRLTQLSPKGREGRHDQVKKFFLRHDGALHSQR